MFGVAEAAAAYSNTKLRIKQLEVLIAKLPDLDAPAPELRTKAVPRKKTYMAPEHESEIVAGYQAGATVHELGRKFKIHRNTVSRVLKRHGVEMRMQGLSPERIERAVRLYREGWSLARIGDLLKVDAGMVRARLREQGVSMRDPHGRLR